MSRYLTAAMIFLLATFLLAMQMAFADERISLNPLNVPGYVASLDTVIKTAADRHSWTVREADGAGWTVALENYKGRTLVMRIDRSADELDFAYVSERRDDCDDCQIEAGHYNRWISNLRRSIALEFHKSAIEDARQAWVESNGGA